MSRNILVWLVSIEGSKVPSRRGKKHTKALHKIVCVAFRFPSRTNHVWNIHLIPCRSSRLPFRYIWKKSLCAFTAFLLSCLVTRTVAQAISATELVRPGENGSSQLQFGGGENIFNQFNVLPASLSALLCLALHCTFPLSIVPCFTLYMHCLAPKKSVKNRSVQQQSVKGRTGIFFHSFLPLRLETSRTGSASLSWNPQCMFNRFQQEQTDCTTLLLNSLSATGPNSTQIKIHHPVRQHLHRRAHKSRCLLSTEPNNTLIKLPHSD